MAPVCSRCDSLSSSLIARRASNFPRSPSLVLSYKNFCYYSQGEDARPDTVILCSEADRAFRSSSALWQITNADTGSLTHVLASGRASLIEPIYPSTLPVISKRPAKESHPNRSRISKPLFEAQLGRALPLISNVQPSSIPYTSPIRPRPFSTLLIHPSRLLLLSCPSSNSPLSPPPRRRPSSMPSLPTSSTSRS
jgi:hypothetical protein